ncbi:MAG: endolytic transglycosylase MltG [Flavicella sp.]
MNKNKIIIVSSLLAVLVGIISGGSIFYSRIYGKNVGDNFTVFIPSNSNFEDVDKLIKPHLKNSAYFVWVARLKKYQKNIKGGKYTFNKGMNTNELVNILRSGKQSTVKLTFNNQHRLEELAGRISKQIEADSLSLLKAFKEEEFLQENEFDLETALGMYIPNSYEFYWNTSAYKFRARMLKEYNTFWNAKRKEKAKQQNLTPKQVIALASIVQKETATISERPMVAGLYLNRYKNKWPLQADPTVIFALKEKYGQDFTVKRVLNNDLNIESKYNTYKYNGIPPGPIAMPDISSINAVLNPSKHSYFYMCASVQKVGTHAFAKTLRQHNKNAKKYQQWISKQGINR